MQPDLQTAKGVNNRVREKVQKALISYKLLSLFIQIIFHIYIYVVGRTQVVSWTLADPRSQVFLITAASFCPQNISSLLLQCLVSHWSFPLKSVPRAQSIMTPCDSSRKVPCRWLFLFLQGTTFQNSVIPCPPEEKSKPAEFVHGSPLLSLLLWEIKTSFYLQ